MVRKKQRPVAMTFGPKVSGTPSTIPAAVEMTSLTAVLSADFPLIDPPLIMAILSDYDPSTVQASFGEIRDQLGILEAALVPDIDEVQTIAATESTSEQVSVNDGDIGVERLQALNLSSSGPRTSPDGCSSRITGRPTEMSRSTSASGSGGSGKSTSPTSVVDDDDEYTEELDLLKNLFPAAAQKTVREAIMKEASLPAAIDHLLSIELIRDVEGRGFWPGEEDVGSDGELGHLSGLENIAPALAPIDHPLNPAATGLSSSRSSSTTRKSRKKEQRIIPLVDTLQRKPSPHPASRPSSRRTSPSRRSLPNGLSSSPSPNAWHTIASLAAYLSDILPAHPTNYFLKYLHSPDYRSAYTAVRASLTAIPLKGPPDDGNSEAILQELYGLTLLEDSTKSDRERDQTRADLEICVNASGVDVATVMDLMDLLADISLWPGDDDELEQYEYTPRTTGLPVLPQSPFPPTPFTNTDRLLSRPTSTKVAVEKIIPGSRPAPTSISNPTAYDDFGQPSRTPAPSKHLRHDRQVHPLNWRTVEHERTRPSRSPHPHAAHIPSYALGTTPHDPTPGSLFASHPSSEPSVDDCLRRAAAAREKRGDAVRAAGQSFRGTIAGGKATRGSVASHYAVQAREAGEIARQWEMKAARLVVSAQLERTGHAIDLHHLTVQEASTLALETTNRWYERQKAVQHQGSAAASNQKSLSFVPARTLTVVTGVGRHSAGQRGVLGPAVANVLEGEGWRVDRGESGRGYLVVRGRR